AQSHSIGGVNATLDVPEVRGHKFLYFGFGSNMLAKRIHIQNPTAVRVGPALLADYRLDFGFESARWDGAVATIVPTPGDHVQEGVHEGIYDPLTVYVKLRDDSKQTPARAYLLTKQPETNLYDLSKDSVPESRQPSKTYLQCLVKGAVESSVPEDYNFRLDFHTGSKNWLGAPATIVPSEGSHVYGAIWEIDKCNLKDLDDQESVPDGVYIPISVPVHSLTTDTSITCRAYHLSNQPQTEVHANGSQENIPLNRQPSETYLKVLVKGARESGIPEDYIKWLRGIKHNDKQVPAMEEKLELSQVQLR
ncbi:hypothetical protein M5D96_005380, partial [Drosophila gunungcola]